MFGFYLDRISLSAETQCEQINFQLNACSPVPYINA